MAKYNPKVSITNLNKPKVRMLMGIRRILMIGFKSSSKRVKIAATSIIVSGI
jgi:hypothetical protein